jgi:hypothetical protein
VYLTHQHAMTDVARYIKELSGMIRAAHFSAATQDGWRRKPGGEGKVAGVYPENPATALYLIQLNLV